MIKVLFFTRYSRLGASSRVRLYQFEQLLKSENVFVTYKPLFDDDYVKKYNSGKKLFPLKYYFKRFLDLFNVCKYDKIVIEKELFPYFPPIFEFLIKNKNYIIDIDDAIFHNYDLNSNRIIRFLLGKKIDMVFRYSNVVIAGNKYLYNRAISSGAKCVKIIPTVIPIEKYNLSKNKNNEIVIGWIGSPSTIKYLKSVSNVLEELVEKYNVKLHIIGAIENIGFKKNIEYFGWSELTEIDLISNIDIGIMPLDDTPCAKGKCAYKLIQYMGCGIPSVASPVGMNNLVIKHEKNGYLARNNYEWYKYLERLINNENLRKLMGENARSIVKQKFSTNAVYEKFKKIIINNL